MFARKFNSDGRIRCPTPCRARKATRLPRNVPSTYGPDGSPNGVEMVLSSRSVSSAMSYSPLPPMMPMSIAIAVFSAYSPQSTQRTPRSGRYDPEVPVFLADVARRDGRVMIEEDEDFPCHHILVERPLRGERVHGIQIECRDPRLGHVPRRRHQIGGERGALAAGFDHHDLMMCRVTAGPLHPHPRHDRHVIVHQLQHAGFGERPEVIRLISRRVLRMDVRRVFPFAAADDVLRARKTRAEPATRVADREASGVVEVEMARKDDV